MEWKRRLLARGILDGEGEGVDWECSQLVPLHFFQFLLLHFLHERHQVPHVVFHLGPLVLGEDDLAVGEVHGAGDAELAVVVVLLWQALDGLLHVGGLVQDVVSHQANRGEVGLVVTPLGQGLFPGRDFLHHSSCSHLVL